MSVTSKPRDPRGLREIQLNVRIPAVLAESLAHASRLRGESKSRIVRRAIERELMAGVGLLEATLGNRGGSPLGREALDESEDVAGRAPASPPRDPLSATPEAVEGIDLAEWLSDRTGIPAGLLRRDIRRGAVRVNGKVVTVERVAGPLEDVTLEGVRV